MAGDPWLKVGEAGVSGKQAASVQKRAIDRWLQGWLEVLESESSLDSELAYELAAGLTSSSSECGEAAAERSEALRYWEGGMLGQGGLQV